MSYFLFVLIALTAVVSWDVLNDDDTPAPDQP
jgi:hypothetical protein